MYNNYRYIVLCLKKLIVFLKSMIQTKYIHKRCKLTHSHEMKAVVFYLEKVA